MKPSSSPGSGPRAPLLYLNVLIIATCGLIYELLAGTLASYVLGDSITQFSIIIGVYLSAMGVGAWLSRFIKTGLAHRFVDVELAVALVGGFSGPLLFISFAHLDWFRIFLFGTVSVIGALVGLELPLLMRLLKERIGFSDLVSRVLTFDYLGALVASLLFPLFLVPKLGLVRTSLLFGLANAAVALWGTYLLAPLMKREPIGQRIRSVIVIFILLVGFVKANSLTDLAEESLFEDPIMYAKTTPYQRIVVTRSPVGFRLFLNGNLQFSADDEYRYHEALIHPAMSLAGSPRRVLVLGGGDGLAVREVLRHPSVQHVTLVDLDSEMTNLGTTLPALVDLNQRALLDPRVTIVNKDAMVWLDDPNWPESARSLYDVAIVDFPDPNTFSLGKLYTRRFYRLLQTRLVPDAPIALQATSPLYARRSYWCIIETLRASGLSVRPYQTAVPSFGVWGFALARRTDFELPQLTLEGLRFLSPEAMHAMFAFPADMSPVDVEVNLLNNQRLVRYYENEWRRWQ